LGQMMFSIFRDELNWARCVIGVQVAPHSVIEVIDEHNHVPRSNEFLAGPQVKDGNGPPFERASPRGASQPSLLRHFLNRADLVALRKVRIALHHVECAMAERVGDLEQRRTLAC